MSDMYTEGVCEDGAAILCNGQRMTVSQILDALNRVNALRAKLVDFKACLEEHEQMPCDSTKRRVREAALDFALSAALEAKP